MATSFPSAVLILVAVLSVPWMVPPFPADWAHIPDPLNEKQIAIAAKMTRRIDVFMSYPLKSFDLVF